MGIRHVAVPAACLVAVILLGSGLASAQDDAACLAAMSAAINQASTQCATAGTDTACYGYPNVEGVFGDSAATGTQARPADFFTEPGDQADLLTTEMIQTGPLDFSGDSPAWGLSLMNVQAGLPASLIQAQGGKGVIFMMFGGVEVENGVDMADAVTLPDAGIPVTTIGAADMRTAPVAEDTATSTNVIARLAAETTVSADAVSPDGDWVRVVFNNQPGWVSRQALQQDTDLSSLPALGPDSFTPMQSFYFHDGIRNGVPESNCTNVPSLLLVQGPENVPVNLRVQGVDMRLESTMLLHTLPPGDSLGDTFEIITLFGMVTLFPNTDREMLVPPGFVARMRLGRFANLGGQGDLDDRAFDRFIGPIRPMTPEEADLFRIIERLPLNIMHYIFHVPTHIQPSGVGQPVDQLVFDNPRGLAKASRACQEGRLPGEVCAILGL